MTVGVLFAIAILGATLVTDGNPISGLLDAVPSDEPDPTTVTATAFDPEGTGTPGEHDALAGNVLDGDPETEWHTERYEDPLMGAKSGVGLVIELTEPTLVSEVTIDTDGENWALEIYISDSPASSIQQWGPAVVIASGLDQNTIVRPDARGGYLLVWITDLGRNGPPFRLAVREVSIG